MSNFDEYLSIVNEEKEFYAESEKVNKIKEFIAYIKKLKDPQIILQKMSKIMTEPSDLKVDERLLTLLK